MSCFHWLFFNCKPWKSTLFDKFCAGDIDEHMDIFLDIQTTKDTVIRGWFRQVYNAEILWGEFDITFFYKAAAEPIKLDTLQRGSCTAFSSCLSSNLALDAVARHVLNPDKYEWTVEVHGYEPVSTLDTIWVLRSYSGLQVVTVMEIAAPNGVVARTKFHYLLYFYMRTEFAKVLRTRNASIMA